MTQEQLKKIKEALFNTYELREARQLYRALRRELKAKKEAVKSEA